MKHILAFAFLVLAFQSFGQTTFFIKDRTSTEPIPFTKLIPNTGNPIIADIDGAFLLKDSSVTTFSITSFGYFDTLIAISSITDNTIFLRPFSSQMDEIVILPGENPAHRIIDLAIANRKKNSPTENDAFRYESYSKFIFDINQDALATISDTSSDSTLIRIKKFFGNQHLFLIESASKRTFIPPARDKEEIIAYKVSGFTDPMFSTFTNELQSFSFYDNQFQLMGKTYINPIAYGGTKRYLFIIEDTTVINQDTTFTISFRPRKGKNFDGLKGRLFINTNGYAVEKVITEPYQTDNSFTVKIVQEYIFVNGEKWFPSKLSTEMSMPSISISPELNDGYVQGKGNTYIKNIEFNPKGIKKYTIDNEAITTAENAAEVEEKVWDSLRVYAATEKEKHTYYMMDSISKELHLDYKLTLMKTLLEGKVPLGYVNLDVTKVFDFKEYEGNRLGVGIETSKKLMKKATIGGYMAYGFRDDRWKYGAFSDFHIYKRKGVKIHLACQYDIAERGGTNFQKEAFNINSTEFYRRLYIKNMDFQQLTEAALSGYLTSNFKLSLIGNYQWIYPTQGYQFTPSDPTVFQYVYRYNLAETSLEIKWNIREKIMQLGDTRIAGGTKYPKINLQVTKGWKGVFTSNYDYWRLHLDIGQDISVRGAGKISWLLSGGKTIGNVPLFLQQVAIGTGKNGNLSIKNTFETMLPSEFYSNQQAAVFTRFSFMAIKTNKKWFTPQIALHHAVGYGSMTNKTDHSVEFKTMEKGFYEGGVIVDKIINSGFSGIGMGLFYRYGAYSNTDWQQNLMFKISLSMNF